MFQLFKRNYYKKSFWNIFKLRRGIVSGVASRRVNHEEQMITYLKDNVH